MYFTLIEPPKEQAGYQRLARIKDQMGILGIAGEFALLEQPEKIGSIIEQAVRRRYSTIVVVGGTETIALAVRAIAAHDVVLGLLPTDPLSDAASLVGAKTLDEGLTALQRRRWASFPVLTLQNSHRTITPVTITLGKTPFTLHGKGWQIQGTGGTLILTPSSSTGMIDIAHNAGTQKSGWLQQLFKKDDDHRAITRMSETALALETEVSVACMIDGSKICTTPLTMQSGDQHVKLIVAKAG